ncbi:MULTISPECIES: hypothetical protein [Flavobacterium]|uniref:Lipocalin-like domain-containing protein n=1 Tax=Flavobacterium suzhouense TaxID=1529638 RepID=A0ABW5NYP9_9FLAO|nr:hypothetical protein [Flavobacterium sp. AG291]RDI13254.1 hypothetical protein DEU42_103164 [Flavobacterium sp. AG291]
MKKINLFVSMLAVAGLGFTSCSDDDNNSTSENVKIEGTYNLKEVNTAAETDFDQDNDSHINQMEESDCYNNGRIVLNSDNTFEYKITGILVSGGEAGCAETKTVTGVYTSQPAADPNNALITLTYDDNGQTATRQFTKIGTELSWSDNTILSTYPDRNDEGAAVLVPGATEYVYKK